MRIALLIDQYLNPSGVGVFTRALVDGLLSAGRHQYVLCCSGQEEARAVELATGGDVVALPARNLLWPAWHLVNAPPLEFFTGEVDGVHALSPSVRIPTRSPYLMTVHDMAVVDHPDEKPWHRRWFGQVKFRALKTSPKKNHTYAISAFSAERLAAYLECPAHEIPVIHHGVDRRQFRPADSDAVERVLRLYGLDDTPYFLFTGVVSPRKNLQVLLQALRSLVASGVERTLVLTTPYRGFRESDFWDSARRLGITSHVQTTGPVAAADLAALYSGAEALVYPSKYEGFGMPVLEAMACGTPVLCSESSSLPEIAGDAALLLPPDSVTAWRSALEQIGTDATLRKRLRQAGLERAGQFSWDDCAQRTAALYDEYFR